MEDKIQRDQKDQALGKREYLWKIGPSPPAFRPEPSDLKW